MSRLFSIRRMLFPGRMKRGASLAANLGWLLAVCIGVFCTWLFVKSMIKLAIICAVAIIGFLIVNSIIGALASLGDS